MAYHLEIKSIGRSAGRSAAGAAAYISASAAVDTWTGDQLDYSRKAKPVAVTYYGTTAKTAADFAASLDSAENRKNSMVARELILSLPDSASPQSRARIAASMADYLRKQYDAPVMVAIHAPDRDSDKRNHHAHILMGTRDSAGRKIRTLDVKDSATEEVAKIRAYASRLCVAAVLPAEAPRWSHLSNAARGIAMPAGKHEGPMITGMRRKGITPTLPRAKYNDELRKAKHAAKLAESAGKLAESAERDRAAAERESAPYAEVLAAAAAMDAAAAAAAAAAKAEKAAQAHLVRLGGLPPHVDEWARDAAADKARAAAVEHNEYRGLWDRLRRRSKADPDAAAADARAAYDAEHRRKVAEYAAARTAADKATKTHLSTSTALSSAQLAYKLAIDELPEAQAAAAEAAAKEQRDAAARVAARVAQAAAEQASKDAAKARRARHVAQLAHQAAKRRARLLALPVRQSSRCDRTPPAQAAIYKKQVALDQAQSYEPINVPKPTHKPSRGISL